MTDDDSDFDFDGVRDAIKAFKRGEADQEVVLDLYGDVDGIERSISVARAKRNQSKNFEELDEQVSVDFDDRSS